MQHSQNNKKIQFRQTIRQQFIQSYKKKVRNMHYQRIKLHRYKNHALNNTDQNMIDQKQNRKYFNEEYYSQSKIQQQSIAQIENLSFIMNLNSQQICTNQNFEYLLETMHKYNNLEINDKAKNVNGNTRHSLGLYLTGNSSTEKQKINSLVYRILEKILDFQTYVSSRTNVPSYFNISQENKQSNYITRIRIIIQRLLNLLEYPQLMPLWDKISLISDKQVKQYCSQKLIKILQGKQLIFDPNFILEIITNLIIHAPQISLQSIIGLMKYVAYTINNQERNSRNINQVSLILRSILKQNGKERLVKIIQEGHEHIFLVLIQWISVKRKEENQRKNKQNKSPQCYCLSDKTTEIISPNLITKINLVKLINTIFTLSTEISKYLYYKCSHNLLPMLFQEISCLGSQSCNLKRKNASNYISYSQYSSSVYEQYQSEENDTEIYNRKKYKYILCKSHRMLLRHLIIALNNILMIKIQQPNEMKNQKNRINSPLQDFLLHDGLKKLKENFVPLAINMQFVGQLINILSTLDNKNLYKMMEYQGFNQFADILLQIIIAINQNQQEISLKDKDYTEKINQLVKILKIIKNILLVSYARATDPHIFQQLTVKISYSYDTREQFEKILQNLETQTPQSYLNFLQNSNQHQREYRGTRNNYFLSRNESGSHEIRNVRNSECLFINNSSSMSNGIFCSKLIKQIIRICEQPKQFFKNRK